MTMLADAVAYYEFRKKDNVKEQKQDNPKNHKSTCAMSKHSKRCNIKNRLKELDTRVASKPISKESWSKLSILCDLTDKQTKQGGKDLISVYVSINRMGQSLLTKDGISDLSIEFDAQGHDGADPIWKNPLEPWYLDKRYSGDANCRPEKLAEEIKRCQSKHDWLERIRLGFQKLIVEKGCSDALKLIGQIVPIVRYRHRQCSCHLDQSLFT